MFSHECTYNKPAVRNKSDPLRSENKLKRAETILESFLPPGVDIYSPETDLSAVIEYIRTGGDHRGGGRFKHFAENGARHSSSSSVYLASPGTSSQFDATELKIILPPKHVAVELIEAVWEHACVMLRFYHRPSFIRDLDILYEMEPEMYGDKQFRILPLVYSVLAVGVLFCMDRSEQLGIKDSTEGYKYFEAARKMLDLTDARDIYAIQSIVMMTIFLQCSARIATCYSYLGIAVRAAYRLGLHRKVNQSFNPIELETRRRVFWSIRKMDIYINAILGLPRSIDDEDFDQELPTDLDDECITEDGYYPSKENRQLTSIGLSNAHAKMMNILHHIQKEMYMVKFPGSAGSGPDGHLTPQQFDLILARCVLLEKELAAWVGSLKPAMVPGADVAIEYLKANRLLSLSYCSVQLILYRPFIHFGGVEFAHLGEGHRARVFARKCINVARRVMYLAHELVSKEMLNGAYWFSTYAIFFSVSCLLYYIHENPESPDVTAIRMDAEMGKNSLNKLKNSSMAAGRIFNLLNVMFDRLNSKTSSLRSSADLGEASIPDILEFTNENPTKTPGGAELASSSPSSSMIPSANANFPGSNGVGSVADRQPETFPTQHTFTDSKSAAALSYTPAMRGQAVDVPQAFKDATVDISPSNSTPSNSMPIGYVPGMMDQFDAQLFGRFLPPYMMPADAEVPIPRSNSNITAIGGPIYGGSVAPTAIAPMASGGDVGVSGAPVTGTPVTGTPVTGSELNGTSGLNTAGDRRFSISNLFTAGEWDDFLSQHMELSGINSFTNM